MLSLTKVFSVQESALQKVLTEYNLSDEYQTLMRNYAFSTDDIYWNLRSENMEEIMNFIKANTELWSLISEDTVPTVRSRTTDEKSEILIHHAILPYAHLSSLRSAYTSF